jgi:ubiquinone/menaquinone biosynthesis C-methylase UbiE
VVHIKNKQNVVNYFDEYATGGKWSQLYGNEDPVRNHSFIVRKKRVEELLDHLIKSGTRVLDIGCGPGIMAPFFAERGATYYGVDISEKMIAEAKKEISQFPEWQDRVSFARGDVECLDFPDKHFDIVIALGLLEYIDNIEAMIREIVRVTCAGGTLLITVPNKACMDQIALRYLSPIVASSFCFLKVLLGRPAHHGTIYRRFFHPKELDLVLQKHNCKKNGEAFYNIEVVFYPIHRIFPRFALFAKKKVETYYRTALRICATGYIYRGKKT